MTTNQPLCVDFEQREIFLEMSSLAPAVCFQCGTCTAICPVSSLEEHYNPRKIIRMLLLGMKDEVLKSDFIWLCSGCYRCTELCPRGVKITDFMSAIRNIAVREGHIHPLFKEQARLVGTFGRLYEVEDFDNKKRQRMGLPPLKKTFSEVKNIVENSELKEMIE